ncbi:MAG: DinB family protein [Bryobacteraceae bacterium]|jgi:uncharacterized damage-inducible protein DinB
MHPLPEPWLRGPIEGAHALTAPVLYAFQQAREDLARYTAGLSHEQLWATPHGFGSVGFHVRHIAGSTERLMAYVQGKQLTPEQLAALAAEHEAPREARHEAQHETGPDRDALLAELDRVFREAEAVVRQIDPATLAQPREVGRQRLPTTVIGLLTHIAEHTQRHVGQAISAAKWAGCSGQ